MKILGAIALLTLVGCVHPQDRFDKEHELKQRNAQQCRVACDDAMKSYNPMTGECECYPPEHYYKLKYRKKR